RNGHVARGAARVLAKRADDPRTTERPDRVDEGLKSSQVTDVHIFGRRGPAQAKFTPLALRELGQGADVDIIVYPEDFEFDEGSTEGIGPSHQVQQVTQTLTGFARRAPAGSSR